VKSVNRARLKAMIEQATVDAYDESEQLSGFFVMLEEHLVLPFGTQVLGVPVTVESLGQSEDERIVVICSRGAYSQRLPILDLPLPTPAPQGAEWIEAYRAWATGAW
jgi:hypothetical protein